MSESHAIRFRDVHRSADPALTVVCCPFAGAGHAPYLVWAEHLMGTVDVVVADLPGRGLRANERGVDSLPGAAAELADAIAAAFPLDRTVVFGHSLGGFLAFEACRRLRPFAVVVSGCRAPSTLEAEPMTVEFLDHLPRLFRVAYRQDAGWISEYRPEIGPGITAPMLVIAATGDTVAPVDACRRWQDEAMSDFSFVPVPGEHLFVVDDPATTVGIVEEWLALRLTVNGDA